MNIIQFRHPFTCMVSGPTGSGKTLLVRRILKSYKLLINIKTNTLRVLWAYGQWQPLYNQTISGVIVRYVSGIPSIKEIREFKPHVLIIDDLMKEVGNDEKIFGYIYKNITSF